MKGGWRAGVRKPPEETSRKVREVRKVILAAKNAKGAKK